MPTPLFNAKVHGLAVPATFVQPPSAQWINCPLGVGVGVVIAPPPLTEKEMSLSSWAILGRSVCVSVNTSVMEFSPVVKVAEALSPLGPMLDVKVWLA